jgi:opacity protein-like surface antigen
MYSGWVYGFGGEYAISRNWTIKAEALFTKFSDRDYTATIPVVGTVTTPVGLDMSPLLRVGSCFRASDAALLT